MNSAVWTDLKRQTEQSKGTHTHIGRERLKDNKTQNKTYKTKKQAKTKNPNQGKKPKNRTTKRVCVCDREREDREERD